MFQKVCLIILSSFTVIFLRFDRLRIKYKSQILACKQKQKLSLTRALYAVLFSIKNDSFTSFENGTVKLSGKETKWASLEVRTHPTFLETLISRYDFRPVK